MLGYADTHLHRQRCARRKEKKRGEDRKEELRREARRLMVGFGRFQMPVCNGEQRQKKKRERGEASRHMTCVDGSAERREMGKQCTESSVVAKDYYYFTTL